VISYPSGSAAWLLVNWRGRNRLLVYLGWALDDGVATDVYQRHPSSGNWLWPKEGRDNRFTVETVTKGPADATDAVLITNLSGTTHLVNLPPDLATRPAFRIRVDGDTPHEDVIATALTLVSFEQTVRRFFSSLEARTRPCNGSMCSEDCRCRRPSHWAAVSKRRPKAIAHPLRPRRRRLPQGHANLNSSEPACVGSLCPSLFVDYYVLLARCP
jgi:hypothetical protein